MFSFCMGNIHGVCPGVLAFDGDNDSENVQCSLTRMMFETAWFYVGIT